VRLALASILAALGALLAASGIAAGDETTPCPDGQPRPTLSVVEPGAGGGPLYATHLLRASLESPESGVSAHAQSWTAPRARILDDDESTTRRMLVADDAGPLTLSAVVVIRDRSRLPASDDYSCTTTVATTVELLPPNRSAVANFHRPRPGFVPGRKLYSPNPEFRLTVRLADTAPDRSPFTVRARRTARLKLPGRGARAVSHVYPMREFERDDQSRGCELLCSPKTRSGFKTRVEVQAEADLTPGSLKITVLIPTGSAQLVGGRFRFQPTPFGLDVEVLQSDRRVARLRVAARCDLQRGLSSRCRFKRVSTRL
jgi:hypothetical protein